MANSSLLPQKTKHDVNLGLHITIGAYSLWGMGLMIITVLYINHKYFKDCK